jgi:hypothetical protein
MGFIVIQCRYVNGGFVEIPFKDKFKYYKDAKEFYNKLANHSRENDEIFYTIHKGEEK